jgi:hypothetical protein
MSFDLGFVGLALLITFSIGFGIVAHLVRKPSTPWLGPVAAIGWLVGGLIASEVVFGRATVDEIQPIIDGLAFDEALLGGLMAGGLVVIVARLLGGEHPVDRPRAA